MRPEVKIKKLLPNAILPTYGSETAAGADLYAVLDETLEIQPHTTVKIHTGLSMEIPVGYAGFIYARSSMGTKQGLAPANKVGVIDSDYRGEVMVCLHNHSDSVQCVEPNQRIAQIVIAPYLHVMFTECDELSDTTRGTGGFGSTGK